MRERYWKKEIIVLWLMFLTLDISMLLFAPTQALDGRFYYSGQQAFEYLLGLDASGNLRYRIIECADFLLIATYSVLLFKTLRWAWPKHAKMKYLGLLPGAFDGIETAVILFCLCTNPSLIAAVPWLGVVTAIKWSLGLVMIALCLVGASLTRDSR